LPAVREELSDLEQRYDRLAKEAAATTTGHKRPTAASEEVKLSFYLL